MHAPEWVLKEIELLHPQVRLGWDGQEFWVLQLYQKRDSDLTMYCPWDRAGPVQGSYFDPQRRVPVMLCPVSARDVFSGKVKTLVKEMLQPITQQILESRDEAGKALRDDIDDMSEGWAEYLMHRKKDPNRDWKPMPDKDLTKEDKNVLTGDHDADERLMNFYHRTQTPAVT